MSLRRKTVVTVISKIGDRRPVADACLVVIYGDDIGRRFALSPGEILIGRSSQAHIQIDHESVSRRHAKVTVKDRDASVQDLGSTNGTYVNDEPVEIRELHDGDFIKVGRSILKYLSRNNIEGAYHEEIYRLTTTTGLTRCFNRRYLREQLIREVSRAKRYSRPLSLVTFDVDGFTALNREFGHLAGDAVLAQLGKRVSRRLRREDIFARVGGGEFAIIAPESEREGAGRLAERVQQIVSEGTFGFEDITVPLSVSTGVASLSEIAEPDEDKDLNEISSEEDLDPFLTDTTDVSMVSANDQFAVIARSLHRTACERMRSSKEPSTGMEEATTQRLTRARDV